MAEAIKKIRRRLGKLVEQTLTQNTRRMLEKMVWRKPAQKRRRLEKLVRQADAERCKAVKRSENVTKVLQFFRMLGGRQRNVKYHRRWATEN